MEGGRVSGRTIACHPDTLASKKSRRVDATRRLLSFGFQAGGGVRHATPSAGNDST